MILKILKLDTGLGDPTNCYIVADKKTKEAFIIDPGAEPEKIINMIEILKVKVKYIIITHCHGDHTGALSKVKEQLGGKILIHRLDAEGLYKEEINLSYYIGMDNPELEADSRLDDKDKIHLGNVEFNVIHTPGHTKGRNMYLLS